MKYLAIIFIFPLISFSNFHTLKDEYLKKNQDLKIQSLTQMQIENNLQIIDLAYNPYVTGRGGYSDGRPPSFSTFQQDTARYFLGGVIGKKFWWGGELQFQTGFDIQDLSNQNPVVLGSFGGTKANVYTNKLMFTQDLWKNFLGKQYKLDKSLNNLKSETNKLQATKISQDGLLQLFQSYIDAKFQRSLIGLSDESLIRAKRRKKLAKSRYRDGLSLKVDTLQADSALISIKDNQQTYNLQLDEKLDSLSSLINKRVNKDDIGSNLSSSITSIPDDILNSSSIDLKILNEKIRLSELELAQSKTVDGIDLNLNVEFSRSGVDPKFGDSVGDSISDKTFDNKSISLNVFYPIGKSAANVDQENKRIQNEIEKVRLKKVQDSLKNNSVKFQNMIRNLEKNIQMSDEKIKLFGKVYKEQTRRYEKGQIEIDLVLASEDSITNAKISKLNYLKNYHQLGANIYYMAGRLDEYLKGYRE